jgi:hypothetical protein
MADSLYEPTIERLVADHQERRFPVVTPRSTRPALVRGKADAIIGMRRSGKTFVLFQTLLGLEAAGVPRERTLYVNFEDERLGGLEARSLSLFTEALWRQSPASRGQECWLFLDEVQLVLGWEQFVRRVQDADNCRVVLSGSSTKLLSTEVATSLRGRGLATEVLPFSFGEHLAHAGLAPAGKFPPAGRTRSALEAQFAKYFEIGGFPEVQSFDAELRRRTLREYVDVVLLRDVAERHRVTNLLALRWMVRALLRSPGSLFSANKLHRDLQSQGVPVAKDAVHEYLAHLQDAFLVFPVERWSRSVRQRQVNLRKCYLADPSLASAFALESDADRGLRLENFVYLELRRRRGAIDYYLTDSGQEVDFLFQDESGGEELVQACADSSQPATLEREVGALFEAMSERKTNSGTIVTLFDERTLTEGRRKIRLVPAWRWMLEER